MQTAKLNTSNNAKTQLRHDLVDSLLDIGILNLPKEVITRVNALKNIQSKIVDIESKFYDELHHLECKYASMYEPLFEQREQIVTGVYEPTEEESKWTLNDLTGMRAEEDSKIKEISNESQTAAKGVPGFWLQAMKNAEVVGEQIQEHDEEILKHLKDIKVKINNTKPYGYTIDFHFNDNEYFTNKVLTKTYELTYEKDPTDPLAYDGPTLYRTKGCAIDWVKGKDVTVRTVKKKDKKKGGKMITKEAKQESFFNYFKDLSQDGMKPSYKMIMNPDKKEDEQIDEELEYLFETDFEVGRYIKEFLVPKAVLYFTGELDSMDDEFDYDEDEDDEEGEEGEEGEGAEDDEDEDDDEEEDDEDDEDEEDEDEDEDNGKKGGKGGKKSQGKSGKQGGASKPGAPTPSECKQN